VSDAVDKWNEWKHSGRYINPVTEENMPLPEVDGPAEPVAPSPVDPRWKRSISDPIKSSIGSYLFLALVLFGFGYILWKVIDQEPRGVAPVLLTEEIAEEGDLEPWSAVQRLALEEIAAWERVSRKAIDDFFAFPVQPGRKLTLCIGRYGQSERDCHVRSNPIVLP
jgi:hypothetical protein